MRRKRDVFYLNAFPAKKEIIYYGLEFREFLKYAPVKIDKMLLLKPQNYTSGRDSKTNFEIIEKKEIEVFSEEDIYEYGDFCWVDFDDRNHVEKLQPEEIAELLYLGHMFIPIKSPFFEKINNRYTYIAHDDGWFCRLYCKYFEDFQEVIANKINNNSKLTKKNENVSFPEEIKRKLFSFATNGLLIDFGNQVIDNNTIEIPIYTIGKFTNMDNMYNDLKKHISRSNYSAKLVCKNNRWDIKNQS